MQVPDSVQIILNKLQLHNPNFLGKGGEGYVFGYKDDLVVKIYTNSEIHKSFIEELMVFQTRLNRFSLPFELPEIKELNSLNDIYYTIEKKLTGTSMKQAYTIASKQEKYALLDSYYDALQAFSSIEFAELSFGNIITTLYAIKSQTWQKYMLKVIDFRINKIRERLANDVNDLDNKIALLKVLIQKDLMNDKKCLVHGDYFPENILVGENNHISAVLDIGIHTVIGDPRQDIGGFYVLEWDKAVSPEDIKYLEKRAVKNFGEGITKIMGIYKIYYAVYFSESYKNLPVLYKWVIKTLNDKVVWELIN